VNVKQITEMEYRRFVELFTVFLTLLSYEIHVSAYYYNYGSGDNEDVNNGDVNDWYVDTHDAGSADDEFEHSGDDFVDEVNSFTRVPDSGIIVDSGDSYHRMTTSIYNNAVEIGKVDEPETDRVRRNPLWALLTHPAVLASIIIGGVLTILFIILLIMFVIYRMRKKDEGSYILDDPKSMMVSPDNFQHQPQSSSIVYMKAPTSDHEFYA
jgi:hypothetical protein